MHGKVLGTRQVARGERGWWEREEGTTSMLAGVGVNEVGQVLVVVSRRVSGKDGRGQVLERRRRTSWTQRLGEGVGQQRLARRPDVLRWYLLQHLRSPAARGRGVWLMGAGERRRGKINQEGESACDHVRVVMKEG